MVERQNSNKDKSLKNIDILMETLDYLLSKLKIPVEDFLMNRKLISSYSQNFDTRNLERTIA